MLARPTHSFPWVTYKRDRSQPTAVIDGVAKGVVQIREMCQKTQLWGLGNNLSIIASVGSESSPGPPPLLSSCVLTNAHQSAAWTRGWQSHGVGSKLSAALRPGWTSTYRPSVGGGELLKKSSEPARGWFRQIYPPPSKNITLKWNTNYLCWEHREIFTAVFSVGVVLCAICVLDS